MMSWVSSSFGKWLGLSQGSPDRGATAELSWWLGPAYLPGVLGLSKAPPQMGWLSDGLEVDLSGLWAPFVVSHCFGEREMPEALLAWLCVGLGSHLWKVRVHLKGWSPVQRVFCWHCREQGSPEAWLRR